MSEKADVRELVALALIDRIGSPWPWEDMPPEIQRLWLGHADAALAALADAGLAVEQGWQPIETAPKNGRRLLLWGYWASGAYRCIEATWSGDYEGGDPYWRSVTPGSVNIVHAPTHWMPIPEPPKP